MVKLLHFLLLILLLTAVSCSGKKNTDPNENELDKNEIRLNVEVNKPESEQSVSQSGEGQVQKVQSVTPSPPRNNFFISGRTGLLSLHSQELISPHGFSIGELFAESTATVEEKKIIRTCISFFESFQTDKMLDFVEPSSQLEIQDYCEYFIFDKFQFSNYLFGRPLLKGESSHLNMIFYPGYTTAILYLSKIDNHWLINGFEVDLRIDDREPAVEKWAPSIKPSLFGNY